MKLWQVLLLTSSVLVLGGSGNPLKNRSQASSLPLKEATAEVEEEGDNVNGDDHEGRSLLDLQARLAEQLSDYYVDTAGDTAEDAEYEDNDDEEWTRRKRATAEATAVAVVPQAPGMATSVTAEAHASAGGVQVKNRINLALGGATSTSIGRQTVKTSVSTTSVVRTGIYNTLTSSFYPLSNYAGGYNFNGGGGFGSFGGPQAWTGSQNRVGLGGSGGGTSFAGYSRGHPGAAQAFNHQYTDVVPLGDGLVLLKNLPVAAT